MAEKSWIKVVDNDYTHLNTFEERFSVFSHEFTMTEKYVAYLIIRGYEKNNEIARKLNYTPGYVGNLVSEIYRKLGVSSRFRMLWLFWNQ
jgi:DNA-binding CsgD family transcriptional regulator